jgi:hypothetical protein
VFSKTSAASPNASRIWKIPICSSCLFILQTSGSAGAFDPVLSSKLEKDKTQNNHNKKAPQKVNDSET